MAVYVTVFVGTADSQEIRLFQNNQPAPLASVQRMTIRVGTYLIDSNVTPEAIVWSTATDILDETMGVVTLTLGNVLMTPFNYTPAYVKAYDSGTPGGFLWEESCGETQLYIEVCAKASV